MFLWLCDPFAPDAEARLRSKTARYAPLNGLCIRELLLVLRFRFRFLLRRDLGVHLRQKFFAEIGDDCRLAVIVILCDAIGAGLGFAFSEFRDLLYAFFQPLAEGAQASHLPYVSTILNTNFLMEFFRA